MAWVTPEQHFGPDIDQDKVFAAVGRALCSWETMEAKFAVLYTILHGHKRSRNRWVRDGERLTEYGWKTNFETRMDMLKNALEAYYTRDPSQPREARLECALDALIHKAKQLSSKRHQIAHSVIGPHMLPEDKQWPDGGMGPLRYAIMAPLYMANSLISKDKPTVPSDTPPWMYAYRIKDIDAFASEFAALGEQVDQLIDDLDPEG
jgi:hypothetical protein